MSNINIDFVKDSIDDITQIRRDIHAHPEMAFKEFRTSKLVQEKLDSYGIETHYGLAGTGVVGTLHGQAGEGLTIALRADMDALPIHEQTGIEYQSTHQGVMHACGHDGHTAMLLGAAKYFSEHRDFKGTIRFIFQPAEEGLGGAREMVKEGLFDLFPCDYIFGMHNMPGVPAGEFHLKNGAMLPSSDTWTVEFTGTGGHGSAPHKSTDITIVAAQYINAIQTIVSRSVDPMENAVVSIGYIHAGNENAANVIPSHIIIRGTARCFLPEIRDLIEEKLASLAEYTAKAFSCESKVDYLRRYPATINQDDAYRIAVQAAQNTVGVDHVQSNSKPLSGSEDFSFYLEKIRGAYIALGNSESGRHSHMVHTPHFDFNDDIIKNGIVYWINVALAAQAYTA